MNGIIPFVTTSVQYIGEGFPDAWKRDVSYPVLKWIVGGRGPQWGTHRFIIKNSRGEERSVVHPNRYFKEDPFSRNLKEILS